MKEKEIQSGLLGSERSRNMGFLITCIIMMLNTGMMRAKAVQPNMTNLEHLHIAARKSSLQTYQSINTILTNYVESRFPHLNRQQQSQMKMFLVHKIKRDMIMKIMIGHLKMPWGGSDDTFARMLK